MNLISLLDETVIFYLFACEEHEVLGVGISKFLFWVNLGNEITFASLLKSVPFGRVRSGGWRSGLFRRSRGRDGRSGFRRKC